MKTATTPMLNAFGAWLWGSLVGSLVATCYLLAEWGELSPDYIIPFLFTCMLAFAFGMIFLALPVTMTATVSHLLHRRAKQPWPSIVRVCGLSIICSVLCALTSLGLLHLIGITDLPAIFYLLVSLGAGITAGSILGHFDRRIE